MVTGGQHTILYKRLDISKGVISYNDEIMLCDKVNIMTDYYDKQCIWLS